MPKTVEDWLERLSWDRYLEANDFIDPFRAVFDASVNTHYIVMDGFDELPRSERDTVLMILGHSTSYSQSQVKVFISSRYDVGREIHGAFPACEKRTTSCPEVHEDISTYVHLSIAEKHTNGELVFRDPALLDAIKNTLIKGANGMFVPLHSISVTHSEF